MTLGTTPTEHSSGEVFRSLVISIFADRLLLLVGVLTSMIGIWLTANATGSRWMYAILLGFGVVGAARCVLAHLFHLKLQNKTLQNEEYSSWESWFTTGAVAHAFMFGLWCLAASLLNDEFSRLVSVTVTFANLIGVCGRSYPLTRLVNAQLIAVSIPIVLSIYLSGGAYEMLAILMIPFFFGLRKIADSQRKTLLENIFQRRQAETMATQIDTTLNSVPQGICMFDEAGHLEIANKHISLFVGRSMRSLKKATPAQMLKMLQTNFRVAKRDLRQIDIWLNGSKKTPLSMELNLSGEVDRTIRFQAAPMENGGLICTFEDITRELRAARQIDHMARFDRLTGLMNRGQLTGYLGDELQARKQDEDCAVVMINIDSFKKINDTRGHRFGDMLLREVSGRISSLVGGANHCARYGGDEFAVVIRGKFGLDLAISHADGIIEKLAEPITIEGHTIRIECTIGIALADADVSDPETVLKHADLALLWAKRESRGEWSVYNAEMSRQLRRRRELEDDLKVALTEDQFELVYQPLISMETRRVSSCEALIRWNHPVHGMIPPTTFIDIAEETGMIEQIGAWVVATACKACAQWPANTRVAVNLSPVQFRSGNIVKMVRDALTEANLDPSRLELEITESLMLDDMSETIGVLNQFKRMGVRISLDDFGTGYSSLSHMNNLPLDKVKIDRSFVTGLRRNSKSLTLIQAITTMGHQLGLSVVVEGVETEQELAILLDDPSPNEVQGYLFSKPVGADTILELTDRSGLMNRKMMAKLETALKLAA